MSRPAWMDSHLSQPVPATDVIARYLTVGGATVDITHETSNPDTTIARCLGCNERHRYEWNPEQWDYDTKCYRRLGSNPEPADKQAREWAQQHAEKCRAMPTPAT